MKWIFIFGLSVCLNFQLNLTSGSRSYCHGQSLSTFEVGLVLKQSLKYKPLEEGIKFWIFYPFSTKHIRKLNSLVIIPPSSPMSFAFLIWEGKKPWGQGWWLYVHTILNIKLSRSISKPPNLPSALFYKIQ